MRILILNWRDPRNPRAGGAEVFTHEIAKRLVAGGDQVEWFSAAFRGSSREEDLDGVHIVRAGKQWTVHWHAFWRYRHNLGSRFDVVIDQVNTIPFFTPIWASIPRFMLIHQLAREVWWYEAPFPVSAIGYLVEPMYLRLYRRSPVFTISASTVDDLRGLGFKGPITVLPVGIESGEDLVEDKASPPAFLYVGRMAASKRPEHIIRAFAEFRRSAPPAQLWLVGDGSPSYLRKLAALARQLRITEDVSFLGRVTAREKRRLMARAHALVLASVREGWGLVVVEANRSGTPAVVYDVPGLRDAVRNNETGLVVGASPSKLADGMRALCEDTALYGRLVIAARSWSASFSWDAAVAAIRDQFQAIRSSVNALQGLDTSSELRFKEPDQLAKKPGV